jgi:hypothetical protein
MAKAPEVQLNHGNLRYPTCNEAGTGEITFLSCCRNSLLQLYRPNPGWAKADSAFWGSCSR